MATVSKLLRLLVSFHGRTLVKCLKQCVASGRPSLNTDSTDVGETAQAKRRWVSSKERQGFLLGYSLWQGEKAEFAGT